jgi:uncharacterized lipoprotein NlpE involved in copper resistance
MEYFEDEPRRSYVDDDSRGTARGRIIAYLAPVLVAGAMLGGYAFHEHRLAQNMAVENQQTTAALASTRSQVDDLTAKVNALAARAAEQQAPAPPRATSHRSAVTHHSSDSRWKKIQSQLDAQNRAIEDTRSQLTTTQGDLTNTRTELTGSIARTHDELVLLQKKGERNYYEFDIDKSKQFQHDGPFGVRLRKANAKHQYADLELMVDDRTLSQKHVNLYQPVMFYTPDSPQAVELVINSITKDHIHGYVSAPRYRQSELASMSNSNANGSTATTPSGGTATVARQKLPPPQ